MERRFEGKTGIVTGGAKGIGRATVLRFIAEGGRVAVLDKEGGDSDFAESLRGDVGEGANRLLYISTDVTDEGAVAAAVSNAEAELGPADILVNDVGLGANPRPIEDIPRSEWDDFMAINVTSAFLVTKSVLPGMRARDYGRIVNLSSNAGRSASPISNVHYSTSKAAIMGFTRKLAFEEGANGIAVNAVAPGVVYTDRVRLRYEALDPAEQERRMAEIPLRRPAQPEEIAAAILFLASDDASYMTGVIMDVNGGRLMA